MKESWLPTLPQVSREAIAVLAGALIAGLVIQQLPALKTWLRENGVLPPAGQ